MPNTCAAYGCNYRFGPETKERGITFHLLPPPNDERRKLWIANSRRIDPVTKLQWNPTSKYVYFCSEHFMPSDFDPTNKPTGRRLKDTAVPTVFTFPTAPIVATHDYSPPELSMGRGRVFCRTRKSKHRKVVMLPKKIKLLQETSNSNVESVTIISFQHLNYDEKLQPIFEKAILDLQYPEESEGDPEEEYYDDEYTEPQDGLPFEDDNEDNLDEEEVDEPDNENELVPRKKARLSGSEADIEKVDKATDTSTEGPGNITDDSKAAEKETRDGTAPVGVDAGTSVKVIVREPPRKNGDIVKTPTTTATTPNDNVVRRKIPVVMREISMIEDVEELRIKAYKIAEDNVKLKKQVNYLESKLQELVAQIRMK